MNKTDYKKDINFAELPFTMENAILLKNQHREKMVALSIDEKIKIVESLRERIKPIRAIKRSTPP